MRAAVVEALGQQMDSSALQPVLRTLRQAVRALATMPVLLACSAPLHAQEVIEYYGVEITVDPLQELRIPIPGGSDEVWVEFRAPIDGAAWIDSLRTE